MTLQDIDLPEVKAMHQNARFYKEGERDYVEISFVGSKDTVIEKVAPKHMSAFRSEWDAFCDGKPVKQRDGTVLTDIPGMNEQQAAEYVRRNVHTAEEFAALSDAQCQALGHGTLTLRKPARELLMLRHHEEKERVKDILTKAAATIGPRPAETYASQSDLAEVKQGLADLSKNVSDLVAALAPKKRKP